MPLTFCERIVLAISISAVAFAGWGAEDQEPVYVEIWRDGDDGLTNKLSDAIKSAFATSDAFALKRGDKNKTLTITIPTNVHLRRVENHNEVFYTVELKQSSPERTETDSGSCEDDKLSVCADQIFRSARAETGSESIIPRSDFLYARWTQTYSPPPSALAPVLKVGQLAFRSPGK